MRITAYQPINSNCTIHVYGRCGAFGYAVEDKDTLPSQLQWFINKAGYNDIKVINHGLWGGEDKNIDHDFLLDMLGMKEGDIVLFYRHVLDPHIMAQLEKRGMWYRDVTHEWHQYPEASWCFYNYPGHMSAVGYRNVAELICNDLIAHQFKCRPIDNIFASQNIKSDHINYYLKKHAHNEAFDSEIAQYVAQIKVQFPLSEDMKCGAIVMNCNPFTYGHRYLIETASKQVDRLYIFVVEENKSFFKFNDRFEMVKQGTADIENVCVVPSGKFIISAFTFPEYFMKDYVKEKGFDMSSDVEIFGSKIAPALNITKRFAGEEPFDVVTAKYNETMKEILPQYGVEFVEIPRATTNNNVVINATLVRKMLQENNFKEMEQFVPQSTFDILRSKYVK
jgi:[citrate (pro-3S)-lyase] ligase